MINPEHLNEAARLAYEAFADNLECGRIFEWKELEEGLREAWRAAIMTAAEYLGSPDIEPSEGAK